MQDRMRVRVNERVASEIGSRKVRQRYRYSSLNLSPLKERFATIRRKIVKLKKRIDLSQPPLLFQRSLL